MPEEKAHENTMEMLESLLPTYYHDIPLSINYNRKLLTSVIYWLYTQVAKLSIYYLVLT